MSDEHVSRYEYDKLYEKVEHMDKKIDEINTQLTKQKGFIGGVIFVSSSLAALITVLWQAAKLKFLGG